MTLSVDIEKRIGRFHLVSRFSTEGGRFALLGASGCGKTMTLRCIAGIDKPDRGRIVLGDRVLFDSEKKINLPAREREVGYLFQNDALFPNMTVRKNILCTAKDRDFAEKLLDSFSLTDVADQYPAELSGGQSQRTALARMLAAKPKAILLDEPFSQLDNYLRTRMEHEILDILETFHGPSILVTHDRNEAYRLADRIGAMDAGTVVEVQEKQDFFDHPRTVAAARLTGCKNISRLCRKEDGQYFADDWGIPVAVPESLSANAPSGAAANAEAGAPSDVAANVEAVDAASHVGYRAHYFEFVSEAAEVGAGCFDCALQRVIEDTFSMVICFRQAGHTADTPDSLLTWIVGKDAWDSVRAEVLSGRFRLRLRPEYLMFLRGVE